MSVNIVDRLAFHIADRLAIRIADRLAIRIADRLTFHVADPVQEVGQAVYHLNTDDLEDELPHLLYDVLGEWIRSPAAWIFSRRDVEATGAISLSGQKPAFLTLDWRADDHNHDSDVGVAHNNE